MANKKTKKKTRKLTRTKRPKARTLKRAATGGPIRVDLEFTGICLAINVKDQDAGLIAPNIIAIRPPNGVPPHIAFIAVDDQDVPAAPSWLKKVPGASSFLHGVINGDIITIDGSKSGKPNPLTSFDPVASIPHCFNGWSALPFKSDYVPARGALPDGDFVSMLFMFGAGDLGATEVTHGKWRFVGNGANNPPCEDHFAETITYSCEVPGPMVTIHLRPLPSATGTGDTLDLTLTPANGSSVRIHIGNNMPGDLRYVLQHKPAPMPMPMPSHFPVLYLAKTDPAKGPSPKPVGMVVRSPTGGLCGPGYGGP